MHLASLQQIFDWFVKSLWPFLREYATLLTAIWAAAATIYGVFLTRKLLRAEVEPGITDAQVTVEPFDLPSFTFFKGSFVAVNSGRRRCNLTSVRVLHESLNFETTDITDQKTRDFTAKDKGTIGKQLPLSINRNKEKRIFFIGSHKVETLEELPETLSLEVTFDCSKEPLLYGMVRKSDTKIYGPAR